LADDYYELRPKAWVRINLVDTMPYNPQIQVAAFSDFDDSFEAEGLVPEGYYDILGVVGGVNSTLKIRTFDADGDYISADVVEIHAAAGDTAECTYFY
jgi:hypothetical protein